MRLEYSNALLIDAKNHVLILRRSGAHPTHAFEADLPGGLLDKGETHEQAIVREIREETGLIVEPTDLTEAYRGKGAWGWWQQTVFIVRLKTIQPEVTISWEHDQFEWIPTTGLADLKGSIRDKIDKAIPGGDFEKLSLAS